MNFKPLGEFVLVEPILKETESGLILSTSEQDTRPDQGIVSAVGTGKITSTGQQIPLSVKPGDRIMFHEGSTDPLTLEGKPYLLLRESSIVAILCDS